MFGHIIPWCDRMPELPGSTLPCVKNPLTDDVATRVLRHISVNPPNSSVSSSNPRSSPTGMKRLAEALREMPVADDIVFGFRLLEEIGRGAFGRVFLASQPDLADRYVVLKISADLSGESQALARFQHTNIVPVYSLHRGCSLHGVCMPFLGTVTASVVIRKLFADGKIPKFGSEIHEIIRQQTTQRMTPTVMDESSGALPYPQAVARMMTRLANGLAHAHARNYLHRDIKPANVLLADDGTPMLLDFGVAEELKIRTSVAARQVGGTPAYMAPEALREVATGETRADVRSDLFSLGLVAYELLTGSPAFPQPEGTSSAALVEAVSVRSGPPPSLRSRNPDVSPGLESIVQTCLHANPARRYPSANALQDDLERYLSDRPLAFAPERSWKERGKKWLQRNPRFASVGTWIAVAALAITISAWVTFAQVKTFAHNRAETSAKRLLDDLRTAQTLLYVTSEDQAKIDRSLSVGIAALSRFGIREDESWLTSGPFQELSDANQSEVRRAVVETFALLARSYALKKTPEGLQSAFRYNDRALTVADGSPPWIVAAQRATLYRFAKDEKAAEAAQQKADETPLTTARDFYFAGLNALTNRDLKTALQRYRKSQTLDPSSFWANYGEGICLYEFGRFGEARGSFSAAVAIDSRSAAAWLNRGLCAQYLGLHESAKDDFYRALDIDPQLGDARLSLAMTQYALKDFTTAIAETDRVDVTDSNAYSLYMLRAKIREAAGDPNGANAERIEATRHEPTDAVGWVERGRRSFASNVAAALESFDRAIACDPKCILAHEYRAGALDQLGRNEDCERALTQLLALDRTKASAQASRGVIRARLQNWAGAKEDALASLQMQFSPLMAYQVAGIYSLLSVHEPEFADDAMTLLGIALRGGAGFEYLPTDHELDPLREREDFKALTEKYPNPKLKKVD